MVALSHDPAPQQGPDATFGALLKRLRIGAGLTQEELAQRAQVSVKGISSLERGVNRAPHKDTLFLLARALELTSSEQAALAEAVRRTRRLGPAMANSRAFAPHLDVVTSVRDLLGADWEASASRDEYRRDRATTRLAYAEATRAYRASIRQWDAMGAVEQAASAREKLGEALMSAARYNEALDSLLSAATIYRARGDVERLLRTLARIGETHALRGTPVEGIATLAQIKAMTTGVASLEARAATEVALAWLINCTSNYADALPVAARAMELADSTANANLQVQAALRYGHLLLMLGKLDSGMRALRDVIPLAEAPGDLRSLRLALNCMGWVHELRGDLADDRMLTERAYRVALDLGDPSVIAFMASNHGGPAFNAGDWASARADFERGLDLSRDSGESWASPWALVLLGQLDLIQGDDARGEQLLMEGSAHAKRHGDLQAQRWAQGTLAERELLRGDPLAAYQRLVPLIEQERPHDVDEYVLLPLFAWSALEMAQESRAAHLLESALVYADTNQLVPTAISALCVRALLSERQGKSAQAMDDLRDALALSESIQQPYQVAKVHLTRARIGTNEVSTYGSRQHARASQAILAPLGERLYAAEAERLLT